MVDEDREFNPKVQESLKERGLDIVDLGSGTFDLYADLGGGKGSFIELKTADKSYKNQGWKDCAPIWLFRKGERPIWREIFERIKICL